MDIYDLIKQRRSVRSYRDDDVEPEKLLRILDAARFAPSASNRQEWRFIIVRDEDTRKKLSVAAKDQQFVAGAPVVIACCAVTDNHEMTCGQKCYPIDLAIVIDHITLLAAEEGLGTCWIGAFHEDQVKKILGVPDEVPVVEMLSLGYAADAPKEKTRLPLSKIVFKEKWQG